MLTYQVFDAMEAMQIWRGLGYSQSTIDLYLKCRWGSQDGLVHEDELHAYFRASACSYLRGYRAFRHINPVLAASQLRRYKATKEDLK